MPRSLKTEVGKQLQQEQRDARYKSWPDSRPVRGVHKPKRLSADEQVGADERDGCTWLDRLYAR